MEKLSDRLVNYASILEPNTRAQAFETASMPFIFPHVVTLPDAHLGKGATVGSAIPTYGAIIPAAVGVDIGCGMMAVRTQWTREQLTSQVTPLQHLRLEIEAAIPSSAGRYNGSVYGPGTRERIGELEALEGAASAAQVAGNWHLQLGSLGSGNHFIEISVDEEERVWAFLHSGSRGVGNKLATKHIKVAQELCKQWFVKLPNPDLAYLVEDTPEFWAYIRDLRWAQHFALLNRAEMMDRVLDCLADFMEEQPRECAVIACHHNYTTLEHHFGRQVWLSRKGAIDAHEGVMGLIPGSMGARSYVVRGKGNPVSLCSAPHGAGRVHSRSSAKRTFTRAELDASMEGIEWGRSDAFLDEIPAAYKPIDVVMQDAASLVDVVHELRQLVNVKGV